MKPQNQQSEVERIPTLRRHRSRIKQILKAGALYFAIVFAVGFVLAPVRELWAIPRFGERLGELMETPLMLAAIVFAARWAVRELSVPPSLPTRFAMGLTALSLLLFAELGVVFWVRGLTLAEYVAGRDPVSGAVYLVMLLIFAAMPAGVLRRKIDLS